MKERIDDYNKRREHLEKLSDTELKQRFYELSDKIVEPLLDLGKNYTSKSIERSILLRMGFSSIEAKSIVDLLNESNLLRKGAGHAVYILAKKKNMSIRDAGLEIAKGNYSDFLMEVFDNNE